jgi:hypothetical protein
MRFLSQFNSASDRWLAVDEWRCRRFAVSPFAIITGSSLVISSSDIQRGGDGGTNSGQRPPPDTDRNRSSIASIIVVWLVLVIRPLSFVLVKTGPL